MRRTMREVLEQEVVSRAIEDRHVDIDQSHRFSLKRDELQFVDGHLDSNRNLEVIRVLQGLSRGHGHRQRWVEHAYAPRRLQRALALRLIWHGRIAVALLE